MWHYAIGTELCTALSHVPTHFDESLTQCDAWQKFSCCTLTDYWLVDAWNWSHLAFLCDSMPGPAVLFPRNTKVNEINCLLRNQMGEKNNFQADTMLIQCCLLIATANVVSKYRLHLWSGQTWTIVQAAVNQDHNKMENNKKNLICQ